MNRIEAATAIAVSAKVVESILNPQTIDAAEMCRVGQNVHASVYKDRFAETGIGRAHIYDGPEIDQEIKPATGFMVYAITVEGKVLGQVSVGPNGKAQIRGINEPCNTKGPNGKPALKWLTYTDQNPGHRMEVAAENGFAAQTYFGRELMPTATVEPTKAPATPTVTAVPSRTPTAVATMTVPSKVDMTRTPVATPTPDQGSGDNVIANVWNAIKENWLVIAAGAVVVGAAAFAYRRRAWLLHVRPSGNPRWQFWRP